MSEERVYFDHAATTPLDPRVLEAMMPHLTTEFGNPNSLYTEGREAFRSLEAARESLAQNMGAELPTEVMLTSGGTEADNSALFGIMERVAPDRKGHFITSAFEHHAIIDPAKKLEKLGYDVTFVKPNAEGFVTPEALKEVMRPDTKLVSILFANNEIGTIQPIKELAQVAHDGGALFHTDAVQALGKIPINLHELDVDAASFSAHKLYGPRGIGALYLKKQTPFAPQILGGGQESKRRSGTQNVAGAVGFAAALAYELEDMETEGIRLSGLRDRLIQGVLSRLENTQATVSTGDRLPNLASLLVNGVEGEAMLLNLDNAGFAVSTGSACSSGSLEPSHVLLAIGVQQEIAHGSLRISLGKTSTVAQVDEFVDTLVPIVERFRAMNPVYERMFCKK